MGLELQLERLSLFQGYKGNLPYTYSIFFYIKYLICLKFILVSDILPKCTVHIIQSKIIPILKLIKKFTTSMLHILAIASFYFHSGQFLQSVWSTYLYGIQKTLFSCACGLDWVESVGSATLETKLFQFILPDFLLVRRNQSPYLVTSKTRRVKTETATFKNSLSAHLYISINTLLRISPSSQNRFNFFQNHVSCYGMD